MPQISTNSSPYTSGYSLLDPAQIQAAKKQYDENGFCLFDNLYNEKTLSEIEQFFEEYKKNGDSVFDNNTKYTESEPEKRKLRAIFPHRYSKRVMNWFMHPEVCKVLTVLLGSEPLGAQTMYYYKPPGGRGHGMHQDNFYLLASPAVCIGAWSPIDDADIENGCMFVVPCSNRGDIICPKTKDERWMGLSDSHISHFPEGRKPIPVPVRRGQTMFFHGKLIHGSGPNRTKDRWRRTFIGHYVDSATEQLTKACHPVINRKQEVVSTVSEFNGGGPCGSDWKGSAH